MSYSQQAPPTTASEAEKSKAALTEKLIFLNMTPQ